MRLLLTSAGIKNETIRAALVELLGKPIEESTALCITTGSWGHAPNGFWGSWRFLNGRATTPMVELGWAKLGVLEPAVLPGIDEKIWIPTVEEADAILVNGGDAVFLAHWLRQSRLPELIPTLDTVWCGLSAGSMVLTPRIGEDFMVWQPPTGADETLGIVGFSIFPHVDHPDLPENTMDAAERWAAGLGNPAYAIDDDTAIKVVDGEVEVVSEGHWKHFA